MARTKKTSRSKSTPSRKAQASSKRSTVAPSAKKKKVPSKTTPTRTRSTVVAKQAAKKSPTSGRTQRSAGAMASSAEPAAEHDLMAAIDRLSAQIGSVLENVSGVATAQDHHQSEARAVTVDRAVTTFQRLVAEAVDDRLEEMLRPLIAIRNEFAQRAGQDGLEADDPFQRGRDILDHVLSLAAVHAYEPRVGEPYDPLIHLAVDEIHQDDLPRDTVAAWLQPGFRTARGKVIVAAKVKVNKGK